MGKFNNDREIAMAASATECKQSLVTEQSERLILDNLDYVKALARKAKLDFPSADLDDLIQAGNVGLIEASRRFDRKRGVKFTTYAYSWIRKYILQECEDTIYKLRVPDHARRKVRYVNDLKHIYTLVLGRKPTFDELVCYIEKEKHFTKRKAEEFLRNAGLGGAEVYSLDRKIKEDSQITFADVIEDPYRIEHTIADILPREMEEILNTLRPQEQRVLEIRFGIGTGIAHTLEDVAREFNISSERVRQIEAKALRKLRHPSRSRRLKKYIEER